MNPSRVTRASTALACAIAVVGVASASASAPSKVLPRGAKVVANIAIPPGTGGIAVGEGSVWAMTWGASRLSRIDPAKNAVTARIKVKPRKACPPAPEGCGEIATGDGAVWVAMLTDNAVARIDPQTNRVTAKIPVGPQPEGIATSPGAVWVANIGGPSVSRIDPATNKVVATIPVGPASACCSDHTAVTTGGGAVWVTVPKLNAVVRIDPPTNKVSATITLPWMTSGQPCGFLAADQSAVWASDAHCLTSSGAGAVTRIDASANKSDRAVAGFKAPIGLAIGFGTLWVADLDAKMIDRVNTRSKRIVARLPVGGFPVRLAVGFGSVWVRDDVGRVRRLKPLH